MVRYCKHDGNSVHIVADNEIDIDIDAKNNDRVRYCDDDHYDDEG